MTAIIGLVDGSDVWLAGDSTVSIGDNLRYALADGKIVRKGEMLIGVAGSIHALNAVRHGLVLAPQLKGIDDDRYIIREVAGQIRALLAAGEDNDNDDLDSDNECNLVVAYRGKLYVTYGDLDFIRVTLPYVAIGSGTAFALGALAAQKSVINPENRLHIALEVAAAFCSSVGAPFTVEKL